MASEETNSASGAAAADRVAISVHVNGEVRQTRSRTLADLVAEAGYADSRIATALNGDFVPQRARAMTSLKAGDHVEVVAPRQGG